MGHKGSRAKREVPEVPIEDVAAALLVMLKPSSGNESNSEGI